MHGDHQLPFTCGSQARRSLIKFFFRNVSNNVTGGAGLNVNVSQKIKERTEALIKNYTNASSWGCWDPILKKCHLEACQWSNGYSPCLDNNYEISREDVGDLIVGLVLGKLGSYYQRSMQDTMPWTAYYESPLPAQWGKDPVSASIAQQLGLFAPHIPLVAYNNEEVYSMPAAGPNTTEENRTIGSLWGVCTSLLSQTAMSQPLSRASGSWMPAGFSSGGGGDMADLEQVEQAVQNITRHVAMDSCPFAWHKAKRHAPSKSGVCWRKRDLSAQENRSA